MTTAKEIAAIIGDETYEKLAAACKKPEFLVAIGQTILSYRARVNDFPLMENLIASFVTYIVREERLHPSKVDNRAHELIKTLGLDEPTRVTLYRYLFDQEGIKATSIVIKR